jgi:hypothetical protein
MTPQPDLAAFLAARLDEEEAEAEKSLALFIRFDANPGDWTRLMCDPVIGPFGGQTATRDIATGLYVGKMSDPARVLREAAAKRAILAGHIEVQAWSYPPGDGDEAVQDELDMAIRHLAAIYADHPDYRQEWVSA